MSKFKINSTHRMLLKAIESSYSEGSACVRVNNGKSDRFEING